MPEDITRDEPHKAIKIEGKGPYGVKVTDAVTGEEIHGIHKMTVNYEPDKLITAEVHLCPVVHNAYCEDTGFFMRAPFGGQSKKISMIIYADGTTWDARRTYWQPIADVTSISDEARNYLKGVTVK